jgi:hypothetical protein
MLKKFDKLYKTITEAIGTSEQPDDIKPTCSYCTEPVSIDEYLKQKRSYEESTGLKNAFKPTSCVCKKCSERLTKMYSGGTKWTGD